MGDEIDGEEIQFGQYVVIQRQNYTKLHKFTNPSTCTTLGNDKVELGVIQGNKYFTTFKMIPKGRGRQRLYELEVAKNPSTGLKDNLNIQGSGSDNRNILNDGRSQKLSTDEITALRDNSSSSTNIVETLITNSNTFFIKTEYSQEKYLKKKQKKYFEYLTIKKPSIRLISEIMYRQDPAKVLGLRPDTLSQILLCSNISCNGNHLLYDSGSGGLVSAAILNAMGSENSGQLVHMHPGNSAQKQALLSMNFPIKQLEKCIAVNVYSVLRHFYQKNSTLAEENSDLTLMNNLKRKISDTEESTDNNVCKKPKNESTISTIDETPSNENKRPDPIWVFENERACTVLRNKVDSLVIISKEHPMEIFKALVPFVKISRPFVIYHQYQEPLLECYIAMRKMHNIIGLKMTSSWTRGYQVLTNRTHPDVLMQGNSGILLTGWITV